MPFDFMTDFVVLMPESPVSFIDWPRENMMTELDVEIAALLYPVLVDVARSGEPIPFGDLIRRTQERHPDNLAIQQQVPIGLGRRLETVRAFTEEMGYPDLTCLVVNPGKSVPPEVYYTDPEVEQARVAAFDWNKVEAEFSLHIATFRKSVEKRSRRKRNDAVTLMAAYYTEHRAALPPAITNSREHIIAELMAGENVADVFAALTCKRSAPPKLLA